MSAVTNLIPKIEGFQPIPNAVMIPFMEAQSAALAYGFGLNYEFGKRKIRSMSNDEFNSLTSEQITNMSNEHTHIILSQFQAAVPRVMPMQKEIFNQYVIIEKEKILQNVALAKWIATNAPSIFLGGVASDSASGIREDTSSTKLVPIGTEKDGKVLVGYISGVAQWRDIPSTTSRREPTPAPVPVPKPTSTVGKNHSQTLKVRVGIQTHTAPVQHTTVYQSVAELRGSLAWYRNKLQGSSAGAQQKLYLKNISAISTSIHKATGVWY